MAQRPNKPCRTCRALTRNASGYCDQHASNTSGWNRREDKAGSTTQRGYGYAWQQLRAQILKRDQYLCQCEDCQRLGRVREAGEVDHITPKAAGGTDDPSNLRAIARLCHLAKTAREGRGRSQS